MVQNQQEVVLCQRMYSAVCAARLVDEMSLFDHDLEMEVEVSSNKTFGILEIST